ncbi:hypothetical protein GSH08_25005 [Burkholderia pseudomallei]|nr:hypothetical protein [Burkholderia pseudomallei]MBM5587166.1 hypothetical protein [Burkholderia pseudomallei]RPA08125.1 hypothetical protein EGT86_11065 [Burkholderia pseudomallei]
MPRRASRVWRGTRGRHERRAPSSVHFFHLSPRKFHFVRVGATCHIMSTLGRL